MFANGAGAAGNRSIGTGAVGGMFVDTLIGVFVIPGLYIIFKTLQERISGTPEQIKEKEKRGRRRSDSL